jgi:GT2 family glycosyltransferase
VVVLTYRGRSVVGACLDALAEQLPGGTPVVVVDNHSDDGTAELVAELAVQRHPSTTLVRSPANRGYGSGMNLGWDAVMRWRPDQVLLLTHDTVVRTGAVDELTGALAASPSTGVVGPLLLRAGHEDVVWSAGGELTGVGSHPHHRGQGEPSSHWTGRAPMTVAWLDGAALLVRPAALEALSRPTGRLGPFREDFFMYWEEVELQTRLAAAGWDRRLVPAAVATQHPGLMPPYLAARNRIRYLATGGHGIGAAAAAAGECARAARDGVYPARRWRARARLTGLRDGWKGGLDLELATRR